jgi:2-enoate reductase
MKILECGSIGNLRIKNRIIMAPMNVGGNNNPDGSLSERGIEYFVERAKGGVGLITTGAVRVTREFERDKDIIPLEMLHADHKTHTRWINELSEKCHDYDTRVAIQLTAGSGRLAGRHLQKKGLAIGPSESQCFYPPHLRTRALTHEEIKRIVKAFEFSASIVKNAGADAIELHGHEGYLLDQFSTSLWNTRTDEYGGSLEKRLQFSKEVIEAVKKGAGENFPVIYRYGLSHFIEGGRSIEEGIEMGKLLAGFGADALDIDAGCYESWYLAHPPSTIPAGSFIHLAEKVKAEVNIPIISSGKIAYPEVAESALENKQADFISLGRSLIADPEWVNKVSKNKTVEIRPCIGCHEGCFRRIFDGKNLSCAVNPAAGDERFFASYPTYNSFGHVLIIGGGIAGMSAALLAKKRGFSVQIIEKDNELGGHFKIEYIPQFKNDYIQYIKYLKNQLKAENISVLTGTIFSRDLFESIQKPDYIFNASGAEFKKIEFDGLNDDLQLYPMDAYKDISYTGKFLVAGGGLVGSEAALNIAIHGADVTIVEIDSVVSKSSFKANREHLLDLLKKNNVKIFTNSKINRIEANTAYIINDKNEDIEFVFDKIIGCIGLIPNKLNGIDDISKQYDIPIINIGDAINPGTALDAIWSAWRKVRIL